MILYLKVSKDADKLLQLMKEFYKVSDYKVNMHKSELYSIQNIQKINTKKDTISKKIIKLHRNKSYEGKMFIENFKIFLRELKKPLHKWRDMPCSWVKINIAKLVYPTNPKGECNPLSGIPMAFYFMGE